ncbi:MAG: XTP/dITP diphosphohydrolase [Candidatus Azotimanducaceae bacterium]|jgi:XTP/dITP diphosphohydrolase
MKVVLASNNAHKVEELLQNLPSNISIVTMGELGINSPEETGTTFVENAIIKARYAAEQSGLAAIADDSGLEVDHLIGAPGIYSSRFAGIEASDQQNNTKLLQELAGIPPELRTARFRSIIVMMKHKLDPTPIIVMGTWEGQILEQPRGDQGFGYDPIFFIPSLNRAAAELSQDEKTQYSHRGLALKQLNIILAEN